MSILEQSVKQRSSENFSSLKSSKSARNVRLSTITVILTVLAAVFKLGLLGHPASVVFDEVHFGGFAQHYLKRDFFLDVHPPGAKMIIAGLAWLLNLPRDFNFDLIGLDYLEAEIPYVGLRFIPALLGTLLVPIMFWTCISIGLEVEYATFGALLVLFENALTCQFRLIFLDAYLIFSSACAICCYMLFQNERKLPFSLKWWIYLVGTGVSLGLAISCKWVGLFTIATIGLATLLDLWKLFNSPKLVTLSSFSLHFIVRFICLLIIPFSIYIGSFWLNLRILTNMGPGSSTMSIPFQQSLEGGAIPSTLGPVGYGGVITIRHLMQKSFLHSHPQLYPDGSGQQQVTLYPYSDANNEWIIIPRHPDPFLTGFQWTKWPGNISSEPIEPFIPVRDGDRIRLFHRLTHRNLHSHVVDPPISNKEHHWEVSCYGLIDPIQSFGDTNDDWIIRITDRWGNNLYDDHVEGSVYNGFRRQDQNIVEPIASQSIFEIPTQYVNDRYRGKDDANSDSDAELVSHNISGDNPSENYNTFSNTDYIESPAGISKCALLELSDSFLNSEVIGTDETNLLSEHYVAQSDISVYFNSIKKKSTIDGNVHESVYEDHLIDHTFKVNEDEQVPILDNDKDPNSPISSHITARKTYFKLIHANSGCSLSSFGKSLPDWAFHQSEVTCGRDTLRSHSVLIIESNRHPLVTPSSPSHSNVLYDKLGFWESFFELHSVMWRINKNLLSPHYYSSKPSSWPFLIRGLGFWSGLQGHSRNYTVEIDGNIKNTTWRHGSFIENDQLKTIHQSQQIHLLGNPLIWFGVTICVFIYSLYIVFLILKSQRYSKLKQSSLWSKSLLGKQGIAYSGWLLHYLPFFFMGRQLYLHHYLTAYYFGILLMTILIRSVLSKFLSVFWARAILGSLVAVVVAVFMEFSPLTYGLSMTFERCERLRWFPSWDFDCSLLASDVPPSPYVR